MVAGPIFTNNLPTVSIAGTAELRDASISNSRSVPSDHPTVPFANPHQAAIFRESQAISAALYKGQRPDQWAPNLGALTQALLDNPDHDPNQLRTAIFDIMGEWLKKVDPSSREFVDALRGAAETKSGPDLGLIINAEIDAASVLVDSSGTVSAAPSQVPFSPRGPSKVSSGIIEAINAPSEDWIPQKSTRSPLAGVSSGRFLTAGVGRASKVAASEELDPLSGYYK